MPKPVREIPKNLKPFGYHGVDLTWNSSDADALAECPFCGDDGNKFSVEIKTGVWHCYSCNRKGNASSFLQQLHTEVFDCPKEQLEILTTTRGLSRAQTLIDWEARLSPALDCWCFPSYNENSRLVQIYVYRNTPNGMKILPTPSIGHGVFGVPLLKKNERDIFLCEGVWDAMALYELFQDSKQKGDVLAVPGCGVFKKHWSPLFFRKNVKILFDNDHPRKNPKSKKILPPPGYEGAKRTADLLWSTQKKPSSIEILTWGEGGYNPEYKSGYDIRDALQSFGKV